MAELLGVSIDNFKSFAKKNRSKIILRPITVLTGENNSGKSSLGKLLSLLDRNAKMYQLDRFHTAEDRHGLGDYDNLINYNDPSFKEIDIQMDFLNWILKLYWEVPVFPSKITVGLNYNPLKHHGKLGSFQCIYKHPEHPEKFSVLFYIECYPGNEYQNDNVDVIFNIPFFLDYICKSIQTFKDDIATSGHKKIQSGDIDFGRMADHRLLWKELQRPCDIELLESLNDSVINREKVTSELNILFPNAEISAFLDFLNERILYTISKFSVKNEIWIKHQTILEQNNHKNIYDHHFLNILGAYFNGPYDFFDKNLNRIENLISPFHWSNKKLSDINFKKAIQIYTLENKKFVEPKFSWSDDFEKFVFALKELKVTEIINKDCQSFFNILENSFHKLLKSVIDSLNISQLDAVRARPRRAFQTIDEDHFSSLLNNLQASRLDDWERSFIRKWLKEFEFGDDIEIVRNEGYTNTLYIMKAGKRENVADLGYGVIQLLPIILTLVLNFEKKLDNDNYHYANKRIMSVEEPEANLHPNLQSKLADFFADAVKEFNVKFVIETHSEYLIRKLQYLTAKDRVSPGSSVIYYFNKDNSESNDKVKTIEIKKDGRLTSEFGPGFYDESTRLMMSLFTDENDN
jgi:predicted ATP-dependent endonuclease of OLD family